MKVKFVPENIELEIKPGQTVMNLAHENNILIRSTCNGMPSCAECRVRITDGDWNVNPPSRKELSLIGTGYYIDQRRLSCQVLCFGDITVDTAEQIEKGANEGPVTKKFLTKVHKATAAESHSLGGVLIEQDEKLLKEIEKDVKPITGEPQSEAVREGRAGGGAGRGGGGGGNRGGGRGGGGRGGGDPNRPQGQGQQPQGQGQGQGGEGGGRSRGGRGRRRRR